MAGQAPGTTMTDIVTRSIAMRAGPRLVRVAVAILGLGLALAACSKCDVPNLVPGQAAPQSCHDGPAPD